MRHRTHLWLITPVLAMAIATGCNKQDAADTDAGAHGKEEAGHVEGEHGGDIVLTADAAKIAGIEVRQAIRMPMQGEFKVSGTVTNTSRGKAVVTPPVDGRITKLYVALGDKVRAGQPIATLQSGDLAEATAAISEAQQLTIAAEANAREAVSQVELANAKHRTSRQNLTRQQQLARAGAFAQAPLQEAQKSLNEAEAELETAQQEQVVHEAQLERAERLFKEELISRTELEQARLEVRQDSTRQQQASRQIELAREAMKRETSIAKQGLLNAREVQAAEAEVRAAYLEIRQATIRAQSARSAVVGANVAVRNARLNYAALSGGSRAGGAIVTVLAPIAGVVAHLETTIGQAVERTTEICEIENLRSVLIVASVPEKQISLVRKGGRAQATVSSYPNRTFHGVVQVVANRLDPKTRTMPVQVLVDNSDGALRADMFATVAIGVGSSDMVLAVPRGAVIDDGDRRLVYIAEEGGKYEEKVVEVGRIQGDNIEIVSGIESGQKVVTKGAFVLKSERLKSELKGHTD